MTRKLWRRVSWPIVFAGLSAPLIAHGGAQMPGAPQVAGAPAVPGARNAGAAAGCPDMAKVDAIESFDFEKEFKLKAEVAAKIKAGAEAAAEMDALAGQIDSDLKGACGNLAHHLGGPGDDKDGEGDCQGAEQGERRTKAKLGGAARSADERPLRHY